MFLTEVAASETRSTIVTRMQKLWVSIVGEDPQNPITNTNNLESISCIQIHKRIDLGILALSSFLLANCFDNIPLILTSCRWFMCWFN